MNLNPLLLPEIISNVLDYVDLKTLKASRLVSSSWNNEAGKILSSSWWVTTSTDKKNPLRDLLLTLVTSPNPGLFFGKYRLYNGFPRKDVFHVFQTYGQYLKALELDYNLWYSSKASASTGYTPEFCQLLIHRVLTEWCPFLEELNFSFSFLHFNFDEDQEIPAVEFRGPTNLRNIQVDIDSKIPKQFQVFLVQILAASTKLKALRITRNTSKVNDRLYKNLTLQHITKNLEKFTWIGNSCQDEKKVVPNVQFLSNQLKILRIKSACVDPKGFHVMINTIGSSLKKLELMDCGFNRDTYKEFQSDLFEMVIKTLVNLETLKIGYRNSRPDYFFSNADSLDAPPHQNLRRLLFPWCCESNLLEVSSVANVVKWFPNLTLLSLSFGLYEYDECTMGEGIRLQEAIGILSGLNRLKDLNLRLCSDTAPGDLQLSLKALKQIPSLLGCAFVEFNTSMVLKTTYALEDLQDELKELKHLSFIRLMGFKIKGKRAIQNFVKDNGIKLEIYDFTKGLSIYEDLWTVDDFSIYL